MIHYLLLCHKDFNQVQLLIDKLKTKDSKIYVHVDWKVKDFPKFKNATLVKDRVKTNRWWFSLVQCELNGIYEIYPNMKEWDHLVIISWQCRPIKKIEKVEKYVNKLWDKSYIDYEETKKESVQKVDRYYFNDLNMHMPHLSKWLYWLINDKLWHNMWGTRTPMTNIILSYIVSVILPRRKYLLTNYTLYKWWQWICLSYKHVKWMIKFLKSWKWKKFYKSFKYTNCSDEIFFQTLFYNSPMKSEIINDTLRYLKWIEDASSPYVITEEFYDELIKSDKLFARKFDINLDWRIVERLEKTTAKI